MPLKHKSSLQYFFHLWSTVRCSSRLWPPINPQGCGLLWTYICMDLFSYGKAIKTKDIPSTTYLLLLGKSIWRVFKNWANLHPNPICVVSISLTMAPAVMFQSAIIRTAVTAAMISHLAGNNSNCPVYV